MPELALLKTAPSTNVEPHWLAGLRAGESDAIAQCYREHADALLALAYKLTGNAEDAEDVVHDVFVGLPNALRKYDERGQFINWLKRVTARTALMHSRRSVNRRETPRDVDIFPAASSVEQRVEGSAIRNAVGDAMRTLSPALRQVFVLKVVEGRSHPEIASILGINVGTSEVRLNRAVSKLRSLLGGRV